jgi:8-oxo-dGTP pyrophosphatase MutT (NUDIX family)
MFQVALKAIILDQNRLLLLRESDSGLWELPGGRVETEEVREPHLHILDRELKEELGIDFQVDFGPPILTWTRLLADRWGFLVGFLCSYRGGAIRLSAEHTEARWVVAADTDSLPLAPGYDDCLRRFWAIQETGKQMLRPDRA